MEKLFGLVLVLGTFFAALVLGGMPSAFIDIPSFIFVVGIILGSIIWKFGIRNTRTIWSNIESRNSLCDVGQMASLIAGITGPVIGIIHMLVMLSEPSRLGPAMAVALITFLYGMFGYLFFFLLKKEDKKKQSLNTSSTFICLIGFCLCASTVPLISFALQQ